MWIKFPPALKYVNLKKKIPMSTSWVWYRFLCMAPSPACTFDAKSSKSNWDMAATRTTQKQNYYY